MTFKDVRIYLGVTLQLSKKKTPKTDTVQSSCAVNNLAF